ncbi:hypothetical protein QBC46DRAFT_433462 [Diplogelasinospora grovesii]|uniref:Uncharacterized protein n=1 Tax=Diplogelasinospora grovesii TaxID=303347 RepID=A0AAN6S9C6_9PEZI|nr:hypothetical protein QBC46DRAFT_433462 [Diplogelasinospora grovesii]
MPRQKDEEAEQEYQNQQHHQMLLNTNKTLAVAATPYKPIPETRQFKWLISSQHVAEGYQDTSLGLQSPWFVTLRCLMLDLSDLQSEMSLQTWRDHLVPCPKDGEFARARSGCSPRNMKWGRRIVIEHR